MIQAVQNTIYTPPTSIPTTPTAQNTSNSNSTGVSPTFQNSISQDNSIPVTVYTDKDQMAQAWRDFSYEERKSEYNSTASDDGYVTGKSVNVYDISNSAKQLNISVDSGKLYSYKDCNGSQCFSFHTKDGSEITLQTNYPSEQPLDSTTFKNVMGKALEMASEANDSLLKNKLNAPKTGFAMPISFNGSTKTMDLEGFKNTMGKLSEDIYRGMHWAQTGTDILSAEEQKQLDDLLDKLNSEFTDIINAKS